MDGHLLSGPLADANGERIDLLIETNAEVLSTTLLAWWARHGRGGIPWKLLPGAARARQELDLTASGLRSCCSRPSWPWCSLIGCVDGGLHIEALAAASLDEVRPLGLYYARARRLHEASQLLVGGPWPRTLEEWMALPGIGRTTAGSILSSAFNAPLPILDGNVKRVLARLTAYGRPPARDEALFWCWSEALLDPVRPRDTNRRRWIWEPRFARRGLPPAIAVPGNPTALLTLPVIPAGVNDASKTLPFQVIGVGVVFNTVGEVLIDQRLEEGLLGGMWEFPGGKQEQGETIEACIARELKEELGIAVKVGAELISVDHSYSHKKLRFVVHLCEWMSGDPQPLSVNRCVGCDQTNLGITLSRLPMRGSLRRCLERSLSKLTLIHRI